ncbi:dipeptidase [Ignavibacteria bacterium]|nr:dipeptidase [Bacteroidota bacterium]MCZ2133022.1 dipeptidase [Bacteroidota bacterium]
MTAIERYLEENYDRFLAELFEFLSIPSVSAAPEHNADTRRCAEWLAAHINGIGIKAETHETAGHPIVYGEWNGAGADAPTVLFYGHYDVQPVDPLDLWTNPPFGPVIRDGNIYARGATDDKGQVFLHIKALEAHLKTTGSLPVNVKLLIEGEEEVGSNNLERFIAENTDTLLCDCVLISDTPIFAPGIPSLVYGLRGLCYMEVTVTGPNRDLHSGAFGGAVENPINALCAMIARLKDAYGRITIPGFYDDVRLLSPEEQAEFARLPFSQQNYNSGLNIPAEFGEFGYTTNERVWARPTLDVNGIYGGYTGEGAKTVLPSKASAKISMRLVPDQDNSDIARKFERYFRSIAPPTVTVNVTELHGANPVITPRESRGMNAATQALEYAYGKKPFHVREGGSIPVCLLFDTILHAPTVLMGFGLSDENAHSPDEHFLLDNFKKGMTATAMFYKLV